MNLKNKVIKLQIQEIINFTGDESDAYNLIYKTKEIFDKHINNNIKEYER